MSRRPDRLGRSKWIERSKRPGRRSAGSRSAARFVAAMRRTFDGSGARLAMRRCMGRSRFNESIHQPANLCPPVGVSNDCIWMSSSLTTPEMPSLELRSTWRPYESEASESDIRKLCSEAAEFGFASVCVNPSWVKTAAEFLKGTGVPVCTVIGFPLGANTPDVKVFESRRAIFDGASELDMVINIGALKSADYRLVTRDIQGVVDVAHEAGGLAKVILETALLTDEEKITACSLAKDAGADFVKTSTGFSKGGATAADIALMRGVVGGDIGVKASGGVRDLKQAQEMIRAGATRIGASVGVKIVQEAAGQPVNGHSAKGY